MAEEQNKHPKEVVIVPSVLGYELNSEQYLFTNYLIPSTIGCIFYILHFACDIAVIYRHYREDNPIWASLTIFFMYLPVLGCYILTISSWELWPEFDGCGCNNIKWALVKTLEHMCFPVWSMWRFAEKIFWSIEGARTTDEDERDKIVETLNAPRTIEFYFFLQGYLQAAPQILCQLHILMRHVGDLEHDTVQAQILSILMSLAQMAKVTTLYQRFKTQKVGGKNYPWFKPYKMLYGTTVVDAPIQARGAVVDTTQIRPRGIVYRCRPKGTRSSQNFAAMENTQTLIQERQDQTVTLRQRVDSDGQSPRDLERRRSSEFYEQPTNSYLEKMAEERAAFELGRETSVVDGPRRLVLTDNDVTEPDFFNPKRLLEIRGMPEDDLMGKFISFLWWFCFLLARMLAISSFAYFYPSEIIWLLSCHFILVVSLLLYDVKSDEVRRAKAIFFVFIGLVYLFCLIEFKIQFKKVRFIYGLFFSLMFLENFVMVFIWWFRDVEDIFNDWWYRYIFYMIITCTILSMSSMLLYVRVLKPKKVVIDVIPQK